MRTSNPTHGQPGARFKAALKQYLQTENSLAAGACADELLAYWKAKGCEKCFGTGYSGRTGVFEVCSFGESAYDLVLSGCDEEALREHFQQTGARSLFQDAMDKVRAGITTLKEVRQLGAQNRHELSAS